MSRFKVLITDYDYGDIDVERSILEPIGARVVGLQAKSEADLAAEARNCDAIMNQYARVGASTIALMEHCRVIARYGVGVDIVDVDAATAKGILVTNVRDYCTEEVADHAIALWMTLARKILAYDRATHSSIWRWQSGQPIHRISTQKVGIVSFGKIGQAISSRAAAFGVDLLVNDPFASDEKIRELGVKRVDKDELLTQSDVIFMQVPMTKDTRHFLGQREFALIKPGAIIINTGRGPTIDNHALYEALMSGRVSAAGLDDPEEEPAKRAHWRADDNPLFSLPNVIVTPHAAYYSEESIRMAREIAASEVARVLTGNSPLNRVNDVAIGAVATTI